MLAFQNCGGGGGGGSEGGGTASLASCDALSFTSQSAMALSTSIDSNTLTMADCTGAVALSVAGDGSPELFKNGVLVSGISTITNGDTLRVRLTSSASQSSNYQATVSVGGSVSIFSVTTGDFTPAAFTFVPATGQALSTVVTSAQTTVAGFDGSLTATVSGAGAPVILVNGTSIGASAPVQAGNAISVRLTSSATENVTRQATVTIGGVSATFDVTTTGDATAPSITSLAVPAIGSYKQATNLDFTANFTEAVTVTGSPRIILNIGGAAKYAAYVSGTGSTSLIFRYTVEAGVNDGDGILVGSFQLNGGGITDSSANPADLSLLPLITSGVIVDTTVPSVQSATAPINGNYSVGQNLDFALTFNEIVNVTGTPRLTLTVGAATRYANYLSGSGTSTLQFRYAILSGDTDTDGIAGASNIDLNAGAMSDIATNAANLSFTPPNTSSLKVHENPKSCKEILSVLPLSLDGIYTIDPDDAGPNAPVTAYCNMSRDGGGWTAILKNGYGNGFLPATGDGSVTGWDLTGGPSYNLADTSIRAIVGPSQNFDVMGDQVGYVTPNTTGNFEYVIIRNYTGNWRIDIDMPASTTTTVMNSYRISDGALAWTGNLQCGAAGGGGRGINCFTVLSNNPQGGAGCTINMGTSSDVGWHNIYMYNYNSDSYIFICNGAQYSSFSAFTPTAMKHRWYIRERN